MNLVMLSGYLPDPPEKRRTPNDLAVVTFRFVTLENYNGRESRDFHTVTVFGNLALQHQDLAQGDQLNIVGKIKTRSYDTPGGERRWKTEIQADGIEKLPFASGHAARTPAEPAKQNGSAAQERNSGMDNERPF